MHPTTSRLVLPTRFGTYRTVSHASTLVGASSVLPYGKRQMILLDPDDLEQQWILIMHTKNDIWGCRCGWAELGKSHAKHVLTLLRDYLKVQANS